MLIEGGEDRRVRVGQAAIPRDAGQPYDGMHAHFADAGSILV